MPIRFRCPSCNQQLNVVHRESGSDHKCPVCDGSVIVPSMDPVRAPQSGGTLIQVRAKPRNQLIRSEPVSASFDAGPANPTFYTSIECISLASLVQRMKVYERLPVLIQSTLRYSVVITLIMNLIFIPVLWLAPTPNWALSPVSAQSFFLLFTADLVNCLLKVAYVVAPCLIVLNLLSLVLTLVVLLVSWGFSKPVHESVHWLAWSAAFPTGTTTVSAVFWAALFAAIVVVALVLWIVIICLAIAIMVGVLKAIAEG